MTHGTTPQDDRFVDQVFTAPPPWNATQVEQVKRDYQALYDDWRKADDKASTPSLDEIKSSLDELHYQAGNMGEPWMLDVERQMRWLLAEYLRPTIQDGDSEPSEGIT